MTTKELNRRIQKIRPQESRIPGFLLKQAGRRDARKDFVEKDTYGSYTSEWIRKKGKYLEAATHKVYSVCASAAQEERAKRETWLKTQEDLIKRGDELAPKLKDLRSLSGSEHRTQRKMHEEMDGIHKQLATIHKEIPRIESKIHEIEFQADNRSAQLRKMTEAQVLVYLRAARSDLDEQATINFYIEETAEDLYRKYFAEI